MLRTYLQYKPAWLQLLVFFGIAFGVFFVINAFALPLLQYYFKLSTSDIIAFGNGKLEHPAAKQFLMASQAIQVLSLFVLPAYLYSYFASPTPSSWLGVQQPPAGKYTLAVVALVIVGIPATGLLGILNQKIPLPASLIQDELVTNKAIEKIALATNITDLMVSIVVIGLLAAIGEELFFRAVLQRICIQWTGKPWAGIILTAALFSAFHFQFSGFLPRMGLGIILGAVYWYTGSLWCSILFHFLHNTIGVLVGYNNPAMLNDNALVKDSLWLTIIVGTVAMGIVLCIILWLKKHSTVTYNKVYPAEPSFFE